MPMTTWRRIRIPLNELFSVTLRYVRDGSSVLCVVWADCSVRLVASALDGGLGCGTLARAILFHSFIQGVVDSL